jgi:hypothetical protein
VETFTKGLKNVYVQVRIQADTNGGIFTDSLYYPAEDWAKTSADEVQKTIDQRVGKWGKQ